MITFDQFLERAKAVYMAPNCPNLIAAAATDIEDVLDELLEHQEIAAQS